MNKTRHVTFRCTQDQYDDLKKAADQQEIYVSDLILIGVQNMVEFCRENPYQPEGSGNDLVKKVYKDITPWQYLRHLKEDKP